MRKIGTKQEEEKRQKRNKIIVGLILVFVMLFSVLGYSFFNVAPPDSEGFVGYNGYNFYDRGDLWLMDFQGVVLSFVNLPNETLVVETNLKDATNYRGKPLYIYSENADAEIEISRNLQYVVLRIQKACPENAECDGEIPTKTCENNFIIIREGENTEILQKNNCVYISGKQEDIVKLTDEFLYDIFGVKA